MLTASELPRAAELLRQGECVALPTETVYGLAADAQNEKALAQVFAIKG
ncbi:MAG: Sua5/YciO/YrdC/YwlC family protein, partial [Verrucomicrobiota bacterium]